MLRRPRSQAPARQNFPHAKGSILQSPTLNGPILGNRRSMKYHRPDCRNYDDIADKNKVPFETARQAEQAGYTVAGNCP